MLIGLKVMDAAGKINDPRCQEALDLLENKYIPGQGWRIEQKYEQYDLSRHRYSLVRWNEEKSGRANDFFKRSSIDCFKTCRGNLVKKVFLKKIYLENKCQLQNLPPKNRNIRPLAITKFDPLAYIIDCKKLILSRDI